ncbi:Enoyl-CoA hydratase [Desulfurella amilsii]|uniref:Enoyl-CoA hydratase n=1 Tax=Desulfurella amilsii TaxID=1562698 RepID=A0A1X4XZV8_9BACT|nr:enoyl-CoA hydratase-related protein [Desulfurella amilsii]OSS43082.1 Enoyl-CoA hydratase [Desulfurella amilsii]
MSLNFFETQRLGNIELIYFLNEKHASAQTWEFFTELIELIENIEKDDTIYSTIFAGKGNHFSAGLDFNDFLSHFGHLIGNDSKELYETIKIMQKGMNLMFGGKKIYIAAVSGSCIGSGLDFISACDLRFCSQDAIFSLKETQLGIAADLGSLQRLPFIIGFNNTRMLAFSSKNIDAKTAKQINLVNDVFDGKEQLISEVLKIVQSFTKNPTSALFATKQFINNLIKEIVNTQLDSIAQFNAKFLNIRDMQNNLPKIFKKEQ